MNLEPLIPGLAEAREVERRNRELAFSGVTDDVLGVEVLPLTPRARLALRLVKNAFACGAADEALEGDVFQFLWLLSPLHPGRALWFKVPTIARLLLRRRCRKLDLGLARTEIRDFMLRQLQDQPGETTAGDEPDFDTGDHVHWIGAEAGFWINVHGGFTVESYLSTPYLVLQQLFRTWQVNHPKILRDSKGELTVDSPDFFNASDRLVKKWYRERRENAGAIMRAQVERRN